MVNKNFSPLGLCDIIRNISSAYTLSVITMNKRILSICMALFLILSSIFSAITFNDKTKATNANTLAKPVIILDAGHGGEDGGAVSESGLVEKDVNLQIALTLQRLFLQSGFDVIMTRTEDKAIYDNTAATLREKKISDIHNRTDICNSNSNNIFISIHQNKFEQSKYKGTQVFYSVNNSMSSNLAESIRSAVKGLLQNDNNRQCKPSSDNVYILKKATVPAVLVECGFLSNKQEESLLKTDQYRNQLAFAIYSGFLEFYYQYY